MPVPRKNIGPSGLTLVIVREDLLGKAPASLPTVLDYAVMAENDSMLNTPPTFAIYVAGLVFQWLKRIGGINEMARINAEKARLLYAAIDGSDGFYRNPVDPGLPFPDERALHPAGCRPGCGVPGWRQGSRACWP